MSASPIRINTKGTPANKARLPRLDRDLDAAVLLAAVRIVAAVRFLVRYRGLRFAPAFGLDATAVGASILHQPILDRPGAPLRQVLIVLVFALAVGVALDSHWCVGILGQDRRDLLERREGIGPEGVLVEVEQGRRMKGRGGEMIRKDSYVE